jgi:hypothetical protein
MILLIQLNNGKDTVDILFDKEGLEKLRNILNKDWKEPILKENGTYDIDHEHFTSKEWGGGELTPEFTSNDAYKIESAKISYIGENGEQFMTE